MDIGRPIWPTKRDDGTVSVAARFAVERPDALDSLRDGIARWLMEKASARIAIGQDLAHQPEPEPLGPSRVDVVFDARGGSRMWKDWLVQLTRELSSIDGVNFEGFQDRVSGEFRSYG
jgi:hypothetical protein